MTPDPKEIVLLLRAHRIAIRVPPTNDNFSRHYDLCQEAANAIERLSAESATLKLAAHTAGEEVQRLPTASASEAMQRIDRVDAALAEQLRNAMENNAYLNGVNAELREELENWREIGRGISAVANQNGSRPDEDISP